MCPNCGAPVRKEAAFCGRCGASTRAATTDAAKEPRNNKRNRMLPWVLSLLGIAALAAGVVALTLISIERSARDRDLTSLRADLADASERVASLERQSVALGKRVRTAEKGLVESKAGLRPLASRALKSVFTVETDTGLGTAWAAWSVGNTTFLITAHHVVAESLAYGNREVEVLQKGKSWRGTIGAIDEVNDLAVVKVSGTIAAPLWQTPDESISPIAGDELLLVGSPHGLEGTVTTGIVSRVAYSEIQTDAAANPGNSGGPALDGDGNVVGVLVSGAGQNLNFASPIQRACVTIRRC